MQLKPLRLKDKKLCDKFLALKYHELAVYAFANIYSWQGLYEIYWQIIKDSLCIFFKDKIGCFLYLSPLAEKFNPAVVKEVFRIMDKLNKHSRVSRIENIEEPDLPFYQQLDYICTNKSLDYLCQRSDLVELKGKLFKSKRSSYNYFVKHYDYRCLPFVPKYKPACLKLYQRWAAQRKQAHQDTIYQGMLEDSGLTLKTALDNYRQLGLQARVVEINHQIKGFTFGYRLNPDTFCILYEITDLALKGLAQFIFRQFCEELKDYQYINLMDDSTLQNLKQVKLSYRPLKLIPAYIIKQNAG